MPENLTPAAQRVLELAQLEAESWARVEPIHVLLALLREPSGGARLVFRELRVPAETLYRQVAGIADREPTVSASEGLVSVGVVRVFELAAAEAREGGYEDVDTDQLLLGVVRLARTPISNLLVRAGLTVDSIRPLIPSKDALKKRKDVPDLRPGRDVLDVFSVVDRSTSKVSLRDLEKKGFRKVKVLRAGDINQLIHQAVQTVVARYPGLLTPESQEKILADAKAEYEALSKQAQKLMEDEQAVERAKANLEEEKRQLEREKAVISEKGFEAIKAAQRQLADLQARLGDAEKLAATGDPFEEKQKALDAARERLEQKIALVNARILAEISRTPLVDLENELRDASAELETARKTAELYDAARQKLREMVRGLFELEQKLAPPPPLPASALFPCPLGHGPMDRVIREEVRLAVCPECLCTVLEPGQLDALVKKLADLSVDGLHRFLEPDES
jgi:hypothetical protein